MTVINTKPTSLKDANNELRNGVELETDEGKRYLFVRDTDDVDTPSSNGQIMHLGHVHEITGIECAVNGKRAIVNFGNPELSDEKIKLIMHDN